MPLNRDKFHAVAVNARFGWNYSYMVRDLRIVYAKSDGLRSPWGSVSSRERGSSAREDDEEPKRSGMRESGADAER